MSEPGASICLFILSLAVILAAVFLRAVAGSFWAGALTGLGFYAAFQLGKGVKE